MATCLNLQRMATSVMFSYKVAQLDNRLAVPCYTALRGMAGHSKWANIRHIKSQKDGERSRLFTKIGYSIKTAIKEGGSNDPKINHQLATVLETAKKANMPNSTIDSFLKKRSQDNYKTALLEYSGAGGIFFLANVFTDNPRRVRQFLNAKTKKYSVQHVTGRGCRHMFDEKGLVRVDSLDDEELNLSIAEDHAIEVGAEDIRQEGDILSFICDPKDLHSVRKGLEELKYSIIEAEVEYLPKNPLSVPDETMENLVELVSQMEDVDEVVKVFVNVV